VPTFDALAEKYDLWFETTLGKYVADREKRLILELAHPVKGEKMLDVELFCVEALAKIKKIPKSSLYEIRKRARFDVDRIKEIV